MLSIDRLNVFYGKIQALWDVSLTIAEAEIVALVGTNGAGKTTLLKTITGLLRPDSGGIEFCGQRIDGRKPHAVAELGLALVPEGRKLFPDMSVLENLEMGAYPQKAWPRKRETLDQVFSLFPVLKEKQHQLSRTLSGGQQQMAALGRGLMARPRLCLIDEPSSGLAPIVVDEIFRIVQNMRDQGITVFLIEQNVQLTLETADRGYVIENGQIILEGQSKDLLGNDLIRKTYLGL